MTQHRRTTSSLEEIKKGLRKTKGQQIIHDAYRREPTIVMKPESIEGWLVEYDRDVLSKIDRSEDAEKEFHELEESDRSTTHRKLVIIGREVYLAKTFHSHVFDHKDTSLKLLDAEWMDSYFMPFIIRRECERTLDTHVQDVDMEPTKNMWKCFLAIDEATNTAPFNSIGTSPFIGIVDPDRFDSSTIMEWLFDNNEILNNWDSHECQFRKAALTHNNIDEFCEDNTEEEKTTIKEIDEYISDINRRKLIECYIRVFRLLENDRKILS